VPVFFVSKAFGGKRPEIFRWRRLFKTRVSLHILLHKRWVSTTDVEPELKFQAPAPGIESFWHRLQNDLVQWKLKNIVLLQQHRWGVAKSYIWWIAGHLQKSLRSPDLHTTMKNTYTHGNLHSVTRLSHKLWLWNQHPKFRLRLHRPGFNDWNGL